MSKYVEAFNFVDTLLGQNVCNRCMDKNRKCDDCNISIQMNVLKELVDKNNIGTDEEIFGGK